MTTKIPPYLLKDKVTVYPYQGETSIEKKVSTPYEERARVERSTKTVINAMGSQIVSKALMFVNNPIIHKSKVKVGETSYEVVWVEEIKGIGDIISHYKVYLS